MSAVENAIAMGHAAMLAELYHEAVRFYTQALKLAPHERNIFSFRGKANLKRKLYSWALKDAEVVLLLSRRGPDGYWIKGSALQGLQQFNLAIAAFREGKPLFSFREA